MIVVIVFGVIGLAFLAWRFIEKREFSRDIEARYAAQPVYTLPCSGHSFAGLPGIGDTELLSRDAAEYERAVWNDGGSGQDGYI